MVEGLNILSPKRNKFLQTGWEGFFPYYAGYPELFARKLLQSANLTRGSSVLDPWNGSGTTTYTASKLGLRSTGIDLNPVMVVVARARLLAPSEADHLRPLATTIVSHTRSNPSPISNDDALLQWFKPAATTFIRGIEQNIRRSLVGNMTMSPDGVHLDRISGTAATLYVALFATCRNFAARFRSSNPTWLRAPAHANHRISPSHDTIARAFGDNVHDMAEALVARRESDQLIGDAASPASSTISLADTATMNLKFESVDFILTSPPYCTRIDYTAATRIELAVLAPLLKTTARALGKKMIGSTQVPTGEIVIDKAWGSQCSSFLQALRSHPSKASAGYYYRTHLDYYDKMSRSLKTLIDALRSGGRAVLVVQDSYYKEIHNDLPGIITDMAVHHGLAFDGRQDYHLRSMSDINPGRRTYERPSGATEAVLCFTKEPSNAH